MSNINDMFEFEKEYFYEEEVPETDAFGFDTGKTITVEGNIAFYGEAEWDESNEWYAISYISWRDFGNNFSEDGDAPSDTEEEFIKDFKNYLISQGVDRANIEGY